MFRQPKVAVLAAVETVNSEMPATIDAACLTVMASRGQIRGAVIDGPLALDNAISVEAARIKEIRSTVAGHADILLVPDLEAGNMLAKQLTFFNGADAAGLLAGAAVGLLVGLLVAPEKGTELREDIADNAEKWKKKLYKMTGKANKELNDLRKTLEREIDGLSEDVRHRILTILDESVDAARNIRGQVSNGVA